VLEIISCDAEQAGRGIGRELVAAVVAQARRDGVTRLRCTSTNDNLPALGFWPALGFELVELRAGAVAQARRLKPSIPMRGYRGLPIRDELDLALELDAGRVAT
jgi:GNAT superfamily N-acetyltransferase